VGVLTKPANALFPGQNRGAGGRLFRRGFWTGFTTQPRCPLTGDFWAGGGFHKPAVLLVQPICCSRWNDGFAL
jgi:hypothetical protein